MDFRRLFKSFAGDALHLSQTLSLLLQDLDFAFVAFSAGFFCLLARSTPPANYVSLVVCGIGPD